MVDPATVPAPVATGNLSQRPFAHLLVYVLDRALTGTLDLVDESRQRGLVYFVGGQISRVWTSEPVSYLGHVLYEGGVINDAQLGASLAEVARTKSLHGQVLLATGILDLARLSQGLRQQRLRKLHHLFSFPPTSTFAFYLDVDLIGERPNDVEPADPLPAIWRGLVANAPVSHVRATITAVGAHPIRVVRPLDTLGFREPERAAVQLLRVVPTTVAQLANSPGMDAATAEMLAYFLIITKVGEIATAAPEAPTSSPETAPGASPDFPRRVTFSMRAPGIGPLPPPSSRGGKLSFPPTGTVDAADPSHSTRPGPPVFRSVPPASDGSTPSDAPPASARGGHRPAPAHPSLAPAEPNPEADRLIEEAEMNFVLDDRHKALNLVRQALTASPKMPAGLALLAALEASNVRDDDPAKLQNIIQRLDSILRSSPACRRGRYYRGRLKRRVGDFDGAVDDLREAVERDPDDLEAKRELRICEAKQKEPPKSGGSLLDRLRGR